MNQEQKLTIRIDDPPYSPIDEGRGETENMFDVARKHDAVLTLAIPMGRLEQWVHLQDAYLSLYEDGLLDPVCHGYFHEDFGGTGGKPGSWMTTERMREWFGPGWKAVNLEEADETLRKCQAFAASFFGTRAKMFVPPGFREPSDRAAFDKMLVDNGFESISNLSVMDPLCAAFGRREDLAEVPFTIWIDLYQRLLNSSMRYIPWTSTTMDDYIDATQEHIRFRFERGLYVSILTHTIGFLNHPHELFEYQGDNTAGQYLDRVLTWTRSQYPDAQFVGMDDLVSRE